MIQSYYLAMDSNDILYCGSRLDSKASPISIRCQPSGYQTDVGDHDPRLG